MVVTVGGMLGLRMRISRCENPSCEHYYRPYRPEAKGALVGRSPRRLEFRAGATMLGG
jgi:hypothetical protein